MKLINTILIIILTSYIGLKNDSNELVGKWECYRKELEDGTTKSTDLFSGEEFKYSCDGITLELNSDFTGIDDTGIKFKYQKKDSILTLGNRSYVIEELTKNQLVIRNYGQKGINISNFRTKFRKID